MGEKPFEALVETELAEKIDSLGQDSSTYPNDGYEIRVMFSNFEGVYYLNCFILGQISEEDIPGQPLDEHFTFSRTTLPDLCGKIEDLLNPRVAYHCDVPRGLIGPGHTHVSYGLLPSERNSNSELFFEDIKQRVHNLYLEDAKGL